MDGLKGKYFKQKKVIKILKMHYQIISTLKCFSHDIKLSMCPLFAFQVFIF